ncbi:MULTISPECIES: CbtA family protein [unclassified Halobacterium]|jgi:predicted cobalt transporter CbtA|uniref:CbtA family protein n=1 Tax=unclassified Halobacterium TaxID=2668073 RepID=UPI001E4DB2EF|nr:MULTISPECIES: CbtA family protein [unclassified Halobacterium]MCD2201109.1 CbtA family protein [Halobacterium sp. KA-4]MCD2203301.1 CbtA family protein [Halobacterium sp. KA-6]
MLTDYVKQGVMAGIIAGLIFGLLMALVANPLVAFADEFGHSGDHAVDDHHDTTAGGHHDSAVSMSVTNGVSILSGVFWGVLLGGVVFGVVYYLLEPAIPGAGSTKSYLLAAAGFLTVSGAPWLVLPPQPPGVEQTLPTATRLLLYGGMMAAGALASLLAGVIYNRLHVAHRRVTAAAVAVLPICLLAIPAMLAPRNAVETTLPSELAVGVTGLIIFGQAGLWLLLANIHAQLQRRADMRDSAQPTATQLDGASTPE